MIQDDLRAQIWISAVGSCETVQASTPAQNSLEFHASIWLIMINALLLFFGCAWVISALAKLPDQFAGLVSSGGLVHTRNINIVFTGWTTYTQSAHLEHAVEARQRKQQWSQLLRGPKLNMLNHLVKLFPAQHRTKSHGQCVSVWRRAIACDEKEQGTQDHI